MIPKLIHQIYGIFDDNKKLEDIPPFKKHQAITKKFCNDYKYKYKLWSLKECEELICEFYPEYIDLWNHFRFPIQRADFIRYLILHKYGGFYIDLDVSPMKDLKDLLINDCIFTTWSSDKNRKPYNAVMASIPNNNLFKSICNECEKRTYQMQSMAIYDIWKGRLVFHTTGHFMLAKVIPKQIIKNLMYVENPLKDIYDKAEDAYFYDSNISSWFNSL